jgi:epsin
MSLQTFGKSALRVAKNYTKGYSDVQAKVREATSNDPWGPSGTQMNEIAQMTYNQSVLVSYDSYSANLHAQKRFCRNNGDAG